MNIPLLTVTSWFFVTITPTNEVRKCETDKPFLKYYKVRSCHKSTLPKVAWKNVLDVYDCMKFARTRNGLAFNYSPPDAVNLTKYPVRNCEVLSCPEIGNTPTVILNEVYDYYSAYGNLNATENSTCIKSVGVFDLIEEKLNYTEAIQYCQALGADLATILTEVRTNSLGKMVASGITEWYKAAYVGLDDIITEGVYETPLGNYLTCGSYRAWAPGHPRSKHHNEDCVILDSFKMWRVINCKIKLPFVCEFYPESLKQPLDKVFSNTEECEKISNQTRKSKCLENVEELGRLFNESSRIDQCALMVDPAKANGKNLTEGSTETLNIY